MMWSRFPCTIWYFLTLRCGLNAATLLATAALDGTLDLAKRIRALECMWLNAVEMHWVLNLNWINPREIDHLRTMHIFKFPLRMHIRFQCLSIFERSLRTNAPSIYSAARNLCRSAESFRQMTLDHVPDSTLHRDPGNGCTSGSPHLQQRQAKESRRAKSPVREAPEPTALWQARLRRGFLGHFDKVFPLRFEICR